MEGRAPAPRQSRQPVHTFDSCSLQMPQPFLGIWMLIQLITLHCNCSSPGKAKPCRSNVWYKAGLQDGYSADNRSASGLAACGPDVAQTAQDLHSQPLPFHLRTVKDSLSSLSFSFLFSFLFLPFYTNLELRTVGLLPCGC